MRFTWALFVSLLLAHSASAQHDTSSELTLPAPAEGEAASRAAALTLVYHADAGIWKYETASEATSTEATTPSGEHAAPYGEHPPADVAHCDCGYGYYGGGRGYYWGGPLNYYYYQPPRTYYGTSYGLRY